MVMMLVDFYKGIFIIGYDFRKNEKIFRKVVLMCSILRLSVSWVFVDEELIMICILIICIVVWVFLWNKCLI